MAQAKKSKRHANAMKAYRQSVKRNLRNHKIRKGVRGALKNLSESKDTGKLGTLLAEAASAIDKAAQRGTIHWKTAARRKSRLAKRTAAPAQQNA